MKRRLIFGLILISLLALSCQPGVQLDKPPDIRYGEDTCDQCGMIINEERFAAAYVTRQGEVRRFDDLGDMMQYHAEHAEDVAAFWVHDYETGGWLKADQAFFVMSEAFRTPMGHGIIAIGEKDRAAQLAAEAQGKVLTFQELLAQALK